MRKEEKIEFELDCLREDRELTIKHLFDLDKAIKEREVDQVRIFQVRIFMLAGSENEAYRAATNAIAAAEGRE